MYEGSFTLLSDHQRRRMLLPMDGEQRTVYELLEWLGCPASGNRSDQPERGDRADFGLFGKMG
jgi:hypothetical protein